MPSPVSSRTQPLAGKVLDWESYPEADTNALIRQAIMANKTKNMIIAITNTMGKLSGLMV